MYNVFQFIFAFGLIIFCGIGLFFISYDEVKPILKKIIDTFRKR